MSDKTELDVMDQTTIYEVRGVVESIVSHAQYEERATLKTIGCLVLRFSGVTEVKPTDLQSMLLQSGFKQVIIKVIIPPVNDPTHAGGVLEISVYREGRTPPTPGIVLTRLRFMILVAILLLMWGLLIAFFAPSCQKELTLLRFMTGWMTALRTSA